MFDDNRLFFYFVTHVYNVVIGTQKHEEKENEVADI